MVKGCGCKLQRMDYYWVHVLTRECNLFPFHWDSPFVCGDTPPETEHNYKPFCVRCVKRAGLLW